MVVKRSPTKLAGEKEGTEATEVRLRQLRLLGLLAIVVVWGFFLASGLAGLDFGRHFDERGLLIAVERTLRSGVFLPLFYVYPSVPYWLTLVPELGAFAPGMPEALACLSTVEPTLPMTWQPCYERWTADAFSRHDPDRLILRARVLFLLASSAAILFTALLAWRWRGRLLEAVVAAAILGTSWEVAYHARWTAPDAVLMAVCAATLWLVAEAIARGSARWLYGAAVAAAIGAATKLTGGVLLLPVLLGSSLLVSQHGWRQIPRRTVPFVLVFGVSFLLLSPGPMVEPLRFLIEVLHERNHYATGHRAYTVGAGPEHFARMLTYLLMTWFTPYPWVGGLLGTSAIVGLVSAWKANQRLAVALLFPFAVYLLYFSFQRVMIVRNLLMLLPLLAVCSAWGAIAVAERWPRIAKPIMALLFSLLLLVNGAWLAKQAWRIASPDPEADVRAAHAAILARPTKTFFVSGTVLQSMRHLELSALSNITDDVRRSSVVVVRLHEIPATAVPANRGGTFTLGLSAPQVNLDFYPSWPDRTQLVAVETHRLPDNWPVSAPRENPIEAPGD
jgi:4-amino-4-deoxy-L-arabinose transferase-like glycosyltransferase